MLIRSQDKKTIYNLKNILDINIDSRNNIHCGTTSDGYCPIIAKYSTEEQAIAVLDKICKCYENYQSTPQTNAIYQMPDNDGRN